MRRLRQLLDRQQRTQIAPRISQGAWIRSDFGSSSSKAETLRTGRQRADETTPSFEPRFSRSASPRSFSTTGERQIQSGGHACRGPHRTIDDKDSIFFQVTCGYSERNSRAKAQCVVARTAVQDAGLRKNECTCAGPCDPADTAHCPTHEGRAASDSTASITLAPPKITVSKRDRRTVECPPSLRSTYKSTAFSDSTRTS